jgi:hypothetical protein
VQDYVSYGYFLRNHSRPCEAQIAEGGLANHSPNNSRLGYGIGSGLKTMYK